METHYDVHIGPGLVVAIERWLLYRDVNVQNYITWDLNYVAAIMRWLPYKLMFHNFHCILKDAY